MAELIPVACNAYAVVGESNGSNSHSLAAAYRQGLGQLEPTRMAFSMAPEMYRAMDMTFWLPQTEAALAQVDA